MDQAGLHVPPLMLELAVVPGLLYFFWRAGKYMHALVSRPNIRGKLVPALKDDFTPIMMIYVVNVGRREGRIDRVEIRLPVKEGDAPWVDYYAPGLLGLSLPPQRGKQVTLSEGSHFENPCAIRVTDQYGRQFTLSGAAIGRADPCADSAN